jgi:hypothetical protein
VLTTNSCAHHPLAFLDSNPAVTHGPPTTIGWDTLATIRYASVDHYESIRPPRKPALYLRQSAMERRAILKSEGFESTEFSLVDAEVQSIQKSRLLSSQDTSELSAFLAEARARKEKKKKPTKKPKSPPHFQPARHDKVGLLRRLFGASGKPHAKTATIH